MYMGIVAGVASVRFRAVRVYFWRTTAGDRNPRFARWYESGTGITCYRHKNRFFVAQLSLGVMRALL